MNHCRTMDITSAAGLCRMNKLRMFSCNVIYKTSLYPHIVRPVDMCAQTLLVKGHMATAAAKVRSLHTLIQLSRE